MGQYGLEVGTPRIQSVGAITFGPGDILFVADNVAATVFAVDVADPGPMPREARRSISTTWTPGWQRFSVAVATKSASGTWRCILGPTMSICR